MNKFYFALTIVFFTSIHLIAQEEDEACMAPNKKAQKALDKAADSKDVREISQYLRAAIEEDEENATPYFEYAMFAYEKGNKAYQTNPNPTAGDRSFVTAEGMFQQCLDRCPDFHADAYFLLGVINYTQEDKETANKWFKQFLDYKNEDTKRFPKDYAEKLAQVKKIVGVIDDEVNLTTNEVPFDPVIVKNVSSLNDEYFPMISPDNELMFYTRKLDRKAKGDIHSNIKEEFTKSTRNDMYSPFDGGVPVEAPFNDGSFAGYGAASLSVDNKEMIVVGCRVETVRGMKYKNCDLYSTKYQRDEMGKIHWSELENLGNQINTNDGWEAQPTLSANGNTLYYTAVRPSTRKDDIFISHRQPDGTWGASRPFDEINTAGKDKSPFLHQDSETMYFVSSVSKERKGVGGTDIFYMRKKEDGSWDKPKNLGYPINSQDDEIGIFVSTDGKQAYFSSRKGGRWNIYSFELYEEARPKAVFIAKGTLEDDNGEPVKDATIEVAYSSTGEKQSVKVNGDDGKYAVVVKADEPQDVMITVKKEGHAFESKIIEKEEVAEAKTVRAKDMEVEKIKVGKPYTINDILYNTASANLSKRSEFILREFASFLKENPTISITIQGHTDDEGDDDLNMKLSDERAKGVKAYLAQQGVESNRMKAVGYGETKPKLPNTSTANKKQNRRTDFVIDKI